MPFDFGNGHINVCKGCEFRHEACHDTCELYKEQRAKIDKAKNARREFYNKDMAAIDRRRFFEKVRKDSRC